MSQAATAHVPPQNLDAERSVLGAMLVAEPAVLKVIDEVKLNGEDFYLDKHRLIFECIHDLYAASKPVDELSVAEALTQRSQIEEAGGKPYVSELAAAVPAAGNAKHYAEIVQENSLLRRLLGAGQRIQSWVHERQGVPRELSERAEKLLFEVAHKEQASDFRTVGDILHDEIDRLEKLSTGDAEVTGTPSGFRDLDSITGGFQPGNLIVLAARPAMGKCLAGSTLVYDPRDGSGQRLDELHRRAAEGEEIWVATLSEDLTLVPAKATAIADNGARPTLRVTTRLGRTLEGTANHRLLVLGGWREIGALRPGDMIGVPGTLPLLEADTPSLVGAGALGTTASRTGGVAETDFRGSSGEVANSFALADVWWDEVAEIEPAGIQETFDLQVPAGESFVADDFVVHNSALVANIAENVAVKYGKAVAFFSLEMSEVELAQRFIANRARIPGDKLRKGKVAQRDWPKVVRACGELEQAQLWFDDSSDLGMLDLRAKARRLHASLQAKGGLGLVIVDYMQLMRADDPRANRVEQVGQMSRGLKILARELEIPVIAISQLSRAPEQRPDKRPILSDLRESGQIEQDADLVAFLYRDEYYNQDSEDEGLAEVIIAKHRNGPIGTTKLAFINQYPKFMDRAYSDSSTEGAVGAPLAEAGGVEF